MSRDDLMSYELTSVPRSPAEADGAKLGATKADLLHILTDKADYLGILHQITQHI